MVIRLSGRCLFQSPPSVRKATVSSLKASSQSGISIPAFREEGDFCPVSVRVICIISIPAFREEGDFLFRVASAAAMISIPAFREEGDG